MPNIRELNKAFDRLVESVDLDDEQIAALEKGWLAVGMLNDRLSETIRRIDSTDYVDPEGDVAAQVLDRDEEGGDGVVDVAKLKQVASTLNRLIENARFKRHFDMQGPISDGSELLKMPTSRLGVVDELDDEQLKRWREVFGVIRDKVLRDSHIQTMLDRATEAEHEVVQKLAQYIEKVKTYFDKLAQQNLI